MFTTTVDVDPRSIMSYLLLLAIPVVGCVIVSAAKGRRPARLGLILAIGIVGFGLVASAAHVVQGVNRGEMEYAGRIDVNFVKNSLGRPVAGIPPAAELDRAEGVMKDPTAEDWIIALWAVSEMAPWLLAAFALGLLAPLLRAADRGEPFPEVAGRRLRIVGSVLLVGIPGLAILDYISAEAGSAGVSFGLALEPHLPFQLAQFLPGGLVLVLAGVFSRGAALQDLERQTV